MDCTAKVNKWTILTRIHTISTFMCRLVHGKVQEIWMNYRRKKASRKALQDFLNLHFQGKNLPARRLLWIRILYAHPLDHRVPWTSSQIFRYLLSESTRHQYLPPKWCSLGGLWESMWEIKEGHRWFVLFLIDRIIAPPIELELLEFTQNDILGLPKLSPKKLYSHYLDRLEHSLSRHSLLDLSHYAVRNHDTGEAIYIDAQVGSPTWAPRQ